jgi:hypothetical protein
MTPPPPRAPTTSLVPWRSQSRPSGTGTVPVVGTDSFLALQPIAEPLSAGVLPTGIAPALVRRLTIADPVRRLVCASGHAVTHPLVAGAVRGDGGGLKHRGRRVLFELAFGPLTKAQRDTLLAFLRDQVVIGAQGGLFGFDLALDGPLHSTAHGVSAVVPVRPVDGSLLAMRDEGVWNSGAAGAYFCGGVVEELV